MISISYLHYLRSPMLYCQFIWLLLDSHWWPSYSKLHLKSFQRVQSFSIWGSSKASPNFLLGGAIFLSSLLNALLPSAFVTKKNASTSYVLKKHCYNCTLIFSSYRGFSSGPPSTITIITAFSSPERAFSLSLHVANDRQLYQLVLICNYEVVIG